MRKNKKTKKNDNFWFSNVSAYSYYCFFSKIHTRWTQ